MLILTPSSFSLTSATAASATLDWALSATSASAPSATLDWARSTLGHELDENGNSAARQLPTDDDVVLVLPPQATSWHRILLPKVPPAKLRAVLDGLLEERLLNDSPELHFALQPGARAGKLVWVAACHKAWLRGWLQALEEAGHPVGRIVPSFWPSSSDAIDNAGTATVVHWAHMQSGQPWLASASELGVSCIPLAAADAHTVGLLSTPGEVPRSRWIAEPSATAQAEKQLDQRFMLMTQAEWLLRCSQSAWNLAQFDLSLSSATRRNQRWQQRWRDWRSAPAWRPARWGLGVLIVAQLLGLNLAAWQERRSLAQKQAAVQQTLKQAFPNVGLVLDAPVQMQRELTQLQQAGGHLGMQDLEASLSALALVGSEQPLVVEKIRYDGKTTYFDAGASADTQWPALQEALKRGGWKVLREGSELGLSPDRP